MYIAVIKSTEILHIQTFLNLVSDYIYLYVASLSNGQPLNKDHFTSQSVHSTKASFLCGHQIQADRMTIQQSMYCTWNNIISV